MVYLYGNLIMGQDDALRGKTSCHGENHGCGLQVLIAIVRGGTSVFMQVIWYCNFRVSAKDV